MMRRSDSRAHAFMPALPEEVRPFNHPIVVGFPVVDSCIACDPHDLRDLRSRVASRRQTSRLAPTASHAATSSGYPLFFPKIIAADVLTFTV